MVEGAAKVLRALEREELARHDLVHVAIERVVVMLVLFYIHASPLIIIEGFDILRHSNKDDYGRSFVPGPDYRYCRAPFVAN